MLLYISFTAKVLLVYICFTAKYLLVHVSFPVKRVNDARGGGTEGFPQHICPTVQKLRTTPNLVDKIKLPVLGDFRYSETLLSHSVITKQKCLEVLGDPVNPRSLCMPPGEATQKFQFHPSPLQTLTQSLDRFR